MGIIEVLFASAVMLFFFQFLSQSFLNFKNFQKYDGMELSNDHLANYISTSADCFSVTPNPEVCNDGDVVVIQTAAGDELTSNQTNISNAVRVGNYRVRAYCRKCPDSCPDKKDGRFTAGNGIFKEEGNVIEGNVYIDVQAIRIQPTKPNKAAKHPIRRNSDEVWTSLFYSNLNGKSRTLNTFRCGGGEPVP